MSPGLDYLALITNRVVSVSEMRTLPLSIIRKIYKRWAAGMVV